jgi:hypothetical protein
MTEHLDVPRGEPEFFHQLIGHYKLLIHRTSHVERTLARVEVALDAGSLRFGTNVAFELEPVVVELAAKHSQPIKNGYKFHISYFGSSCSNQISLCQFTQV